MWITARDMPTKRAMTVVIALFSYRYIEKRALKVGVRTPESV